MLNDAEIAALRAVLAKKGAECCQECVDDAMTTEVHNLAAKLRGQNIDPDLVIAAAGGRCPVNGCGHSACMIDPSKGREWGGERVGNDGDGCSCDVKKLMRALRFYRHRVTVLEAKVSNDNP